MKRKMADQKYWIWFSQLFTFQDLLARKILEIYKTPEAIYHIGPEELKLFPEDFKKKIQNKDLAQAEQIIAECHKKHINIVTYEDEEYPQRLKNIPDFPYVIYHFGKWYDFDHLPALAVVGTRKCTPYGKAVAEGFSKELSRRGMLIVSGLALGVDAHAHLGALKAGGETVAVLGSGVDVIYPKTNKDIFDLVYAHGAVISEYPPGTSVKKYYFPARNRLISALSLGVLVVEAGRGSGSLITANCALEQGKDVFAVPDSILSQNSEGSLGLIQQGAKCVARVEDILVEYEGQYAFRKTEKKPENETNEMKRDEYIASFQNLNETEKLILETLSSKPLLADDVVSLTGLTAAQVISTMTMLEIKGAVQALAGRRYRLNLNE